MSFPFPTLGSPPTAGTAAQPSALNFLLQQPSGEASGPGSVLRGTAPWTHLPPAPLSAPGSLGPEWSWTQLPPPALKGSMTPLGKGSPPLSPSGCTLPAERKISTTNYKSATRVRSQAGETFLIFEDFRTLPPGLPTHRSSPHTSQPPPQSSSPLPFPFTSCPPRAAAPGPTQHLPSTCLLGWGWGLLTQQGHGRGAGGTRIQKQDLR